MRKNIKKQSMGLLLMVSISLELSACGSDALDTSSVQSSAEINAIDEKDAEETSSTESESDTAKSDDILADWLDQMKVDFYNSHDSGKDISDWISSRFLGIGENRNELYLEDENNGLWKITSSAEENTNENLMDRTREYHLLS